MIAYTRCNRSVCCRLLLLLLAAASSLGGSLQNGFLTAAGNLFPSICGMSVRNVAEIADIVFTGKVDSVVADSQEGVTDVALIRVKRILRSHPRFGGPQGIVSGTRVSAALSVRFFDSAAVAVSCPHRDLFFAVRVRDTKIFCARVTDKSSFAGSHQLPANRTFFPLELLAISLPVNLQILEQFAALEESIEEH